MHHIGFLCEDIQATSKHFELLGFRRERDEIDDLSKNLRFLFMVNGNLRIELVVKIDAEGSSVIDNLLRRAPFKNMAYHFCFESSSLSKDVARFRRAGYKVLIPAERAIACDNRLVVYLVHFENGLVELIES